MYSHPPQPTLFPYTTLFRSLGNCLCRSQGLGIVASPKIRFRQIKFYIVRFRVEIQRALEMLNCGLIEMISCQQHSYRSLQARSEEHTSELQSRRELVCRLLL